MFITAIKQIAGDYGVLAPGQTSAIEVPDDIAQELVAKKYAKASATIPVVAVVDVPVDDSKVVKAK